MRLATYNVEWFNALFDDSGALINDRGWSGRRNVRRRDQIAALGIVFTALDADAVMVIEAPDENGRRSCVAALEEFARVHDLRARRAIIGFGNDTQQEIALLYDPDVLDVRHDPRGDPTGKKGSVDAPRFDGVFRWDIDVDTAPELIRFSKPPLELEAEASGRRFRMIGVHAKSKAPHGASNADQAIRLSIQNRRKQLAQCIWLRQRIESHLRAGDPLIVLGDFNDGPGLDEYEKLFGLSGVEIVMGHADEAALRLFDPHALQVRLAAQPSTARFYIAPEDRYLSALLDYIMVSPDLRSKARRWRIWHPFDDPALYRVPELREALLVASDHFPVSLDIDL
ncbi:endonuclease/exonuclease/phosphatase family protein [Rhodovulum imhoffii]|uniref:Endonuclease/exonuclease/phosphatase family protein n=1 Tax=Rhodovulum imhoffii TaxID=365340 RepID=A0A2T5BW58_9RHOB|nr:endonuclease/exonuclease/phosphatase family protein [Rhodovulum imhoffii]MBK5935154.1 endonuclease [Rhodovulum imhoffii]PTN03879.1 endonuclease/exonuclease/phosphatase family protein [Rhodovulum imhoffii]